MLPRMNENEISLIVLNKAHQHLENFKNKFLKEYIGTNEVISDMHHIEWFPFILIRPMLI